MNGFTGLSSFSLLLASKVEVETCWETWIAVHVSSAGSGDFELIRWKRFVELFRRMRAGFRTTLRTLELSATSGDPDTLEGLLPMAIGVFGRRFDLRCATCVIALQLLVSPSQICCLSS